MSAPTIYILYNADASVMGKLSYGYKKITNKDKDKPTCAACDITHGGLSLDETSQWKAAKAELVQSGAVREVKQFHRDELDAEVCVSPFLIQCTFEDALLTGRDGSAPDQSIHPVPGFAVSHGFGAG